MMTSGWTDHGQWHSEGLSSSLSDPRSSRSQTTWERPPSFAARANRFCRFSVNLINVLDKDCHCCQQAPGGFYLAITLYAVLFSPFSRPRNFIPDTDEGVLFAHLVGSCWTRQGLCHGGGQRPKSYCEAEVITENNIKAMYRPFNFLATVLYIYQ